jgi:opacity protein-like surface antigen
MFRQCIAGFIAAAIFAAGRADAADDSGFYIGLGLGQAHNEAGRFRLDDSAVKAFVGYALNDYLAAQVALLDPQQADDTIEDVRLTLDPEGVIVSTVASLPLHERWSIFGKLGWAFYDIDQTIENDGEIAAASASDDDFAWGLGTAVKIGAGWSIQLEYEAVEVSAGAFNAVTMSGTVRF